MLCDKSHEFTKNAHKPRVNLGGDRISERMLDTVEFIK